MDMYYNRVAEDQYYYAYENPYALGLAFGVDEAIKDLETNLKYDYTENTEALDNPFEVQNLLLNTLLGNDEENFIEFFTSIPLRRNQEMVGSLGSVGAGAEYSASSDNLDENAFEFNFTVQQSGPLYLYLPSGYERTFHLYVDGEFYVDVNNYSRIVSLGYREKGEKLSLGFRLPEGKFYFFKHTDYLYTLNMDEFEHAIEYLAQTSLHTTEKSTDDHIYGSMTTYENNKTIMTTIPYDEGWKVFVDGKQVDTYSIYADSLMAFDIEEAGEHHIEFKYSPEIYKKSGIISIGSTIIFAGLVTFEIIRNKKRKTAMAVCENPETTEGEN